MIGNKNKELCIRLQNDDKEAFTILYSTYHSAIYCNVLKLTKDLAITEDIVQDVFITLWEKRRQLDLEQEISGWLFVVSYNKSVSYLKRKLKESLAQTAMEHTFGELAENVEDLVTIREGILQKAIEQLSPQRRKVFELCKLQRKTYEQAAEELQLSKHTVKEYLSGAVISIREYIKQHSEYAAVFIIALFLD